MPANSSPGSNPSSGILTNNSAVTPSKKGKAKAARKTASASKPANASAESPTEILFTDSPNPYHPTPPPFIWIDFPQQNERLTGPVYVIRLGAGGAQHVELSIDGGVWKNCRLNSGYWWFDWSGIQPGRHTLAARMRTHDGRWFRTPLRACERRP
jgi:hypothetical protein